MPFLKLTPKVPASQKPAPIPRAVKKIDRPKGIRSLVGLSYEEIEKAIEQEYIDRGAILLHFQCTNIPNFKLSSDGRFGLRHQEKLQFFQLFIFKERVKREDFDDKTYNDLKWMGTQTHFYYNEKKVTADMQMRRISERIAKYLGDELEELVRQTREKFFLEEDNQNAKKFEASIIGEEFLSITSPSETQIESEIIQEKNEPRTGENTGNSQKAFTFEKVSSNEESSSKSGIVLII